MQTAPLARILVVIPTYDEAAVLPALVEAIATDVVAADPRIEVLVVDDASPDGTGLLAEQLAATRPWLHVLHRTGKDGLGAAYRAGFAHALAAGYDAVGQMDADLQHPPATLLELARTLDAGADLALASRYVPGGGVDGWSRRRHLLSRVGVVGARLALDLPLHDPTGGFRLWRASAVERIEAETTEAAGFAFQVETALRACLLGLRVVEVPYTFRPRAAGGSKMDASISVEGVRVVARLRRQVRAAA